MEMKKLPMCRICLVENVRMVVFANTNLQEIYEKLTDIPLVTEDSRPMLACFICHDKLKQCHELQKQCLEAEEGFAQMLKEDFETKPQLNRGQLEFSEYAVTPTQHISVFDVCHTESAVIKEESPDDCEGQDSKQHTDSEHECKNVAFDYNISPHRSASGTTPPRPYESREEGKLEDNLPLMEFKIEIEEEEVSQEKRQPEEMKKLELETVDYNYEAFKDTPAHQSESYSDDDEPVMEIKTKVEDEQESIGAPVVEKPKQDTRRAKLEDISAVLKKKKHSPKLIFASKVIQKTRNRTFNRVTKFNEPIATSKQGVNNRINETTLVTSSLNNINKDDIRDKTSNICKDDMNGHLRVCVKDKRFKCDTCHSSFKRKFDLTAHIRSHTGEKPYTCYICRRNFSRNSSLTRHIRGHTGEKLLKCDICQRSYTEKSSLTIHIRSHTGEKPFKCHICSRSFSKKSTLTSHIRVHTGEKPFKCDICQRSYTEKSSLTIHIRTHTGEKPFKCDICSRSFGHQSTLTNHIRVHTGEKPFKCDICQRSFTEKSQLTIHIRTHTGEKPYKCYVCQRSFAQKSHLTCHIRDHTSEKPFK